MIIIVLKTLPFQLIFFFLDYDTFALCLSIFTDSTTYICSPFTNTCVIDEDILITCVGISCGPAPNVSHATVAESGRNFPGQATYTCDAGYVLTSAASTRTCSQDGNWSLEDVVCDPVTCDTPTAPSHAKISLDVAQQERYNHGDSVTYSCQAGHVILPALSWGLRNTTGVITCEDGIWTITEPNALRIPCDFPHQMYPRRPGISQQRHPLE